MGRVIDNVRRLRTITAVVARHGLGHYLERRRAGSGAVRPQPDRPIDVKDQGARFRAVLEELGPTFIKFGQVLSTRADMLPPGFAESLSALQDRCSPMATEVAAAAFEAALGQSVDVAFAHFDPIPLASASIAQVHRATGHDGAELAVKIQRPEVRETLIQDLDLLRLLAQLAENIVEESGLVTPRGAVDAFESALLGELDFVQEAQTMARFARNLQGRRRAYEVPSVVPELSCGTVLTMSFMRGTPISQLGPEHDRAQLAANIVQTAFDQLFIDGLFHADPHPGNCLILADNRLALLDFGAVGQISFGMRETLAVLVVALAMRDAEAVARLLYRVGVADERISLHQLRDACATLLDTYLGEAAPLGQAAATELLTALLDLAARFHLRLPSEYALVARAAVTVEGVLRQLDPDLAVLAHARPLVRRLIEAQFKLPELGEATVKNLLRARDIVRDLPLTLSQILMDLESGKLQVQVESARLDTIARNIDALGVVIFMGLVAGGLVSGSLFILARYDWLIWGLPLVPLLALYLASMLFGAALGRYFLGPRLRKISLSRGLRRRRRR